MNDALLQLQLQTISHKDVKLNISHDKKCEINKHVMGGPSSAFRKFANDVNFGTKCVSNINNNKSDIGKDSSKPDKEQEQRDQDDLEDSKNGKFIILLIQINLLYES